MSCVFKKLNGLEKKQRSLTLQNFNLAQKKGLEEKIMWVIVDKEQKEVWWCVKDWG